MTATMPIQIPTMDADASANLAAGGIERHDPFILARFGDGDLYCMKADTSQDAAAMLYATLGPRAGRPPLALADGEEWSPELRDSLRAAWRKITSGDHTLMLGDPKTSDFGRELYPYWDSLTANVERAYIPVHHELFWLSAGEQPGLARFLRAVVGSDARKVLVGRKELRPAAGLLEADFLPVDPFGSLKDRPIVVELAAAYDLVLFCAGRGGKAMIADLITKRRTLVDVGALFDPLFIGNSRPRPGAPADAHAEAFFSEVFGRKIRVAANRPGRVYPA